MLPLADDSLQAHKEITTESDFMRVVVAPGLHLGKAVQICNSWSWCGSYGHYVRRLRQVAMLV